MRRKKEPTNLTLSSGSLRKLRKIAKGEGLLFGGQPNLSRAVEFLIEQEEARQKRLSAVG